MSALLIMQQKHRIFLGSDSALVTKIDENFYRISNNQNKIFHIKDCLLFCSGNIDYVDIFIEYLHNQKQIDINNVSIFLKNLELKKELGIYNIEVVLCIHEDGILKLYQLSEYNDFDIVEHFSSDNNINVLSAGIKTKDCLSFANKEFENTRQVLDIYKNVFTKLSCEQIGGTLEVWEISDEITNHLKYSIPEKNIKYLSIHSVIADVIVGNLVAGNQLLITNANNSFTVDGNGAVMSDASLTFTTKNNNNIIKLDPDVGIMIQQVFPNSGSVIKDLFYVDINGNLIMAGNGTFSGSILASSGKIGGWTITETGIKDDWGNFINSDQNIVLGKLSIHGGTAVFDGNIYARNLGDQIQTGNLADLCVTNAKIYDLVANKIRAGTMSANRIFGGTIRWGGSYSSADVTMGEEYGKAVIRGKNGLSITGTVWSSGIYLDEHGLNIRGGVGQVPIYLGNAGDQVYIDANALFVKDIQSVTTITGSGSSLRAVTTSKTVERIGLSTELNIYSDGVNKKLTFVKGILVGSTGAGYPNNGNPSNSLPNNVIPPTTSLVVNSVIGKWAYQWLDVTATPTHLIGYCGDNGDHAWSFGEISTVTIPWCFAGAVWDVTDHYEMTQCRFKGFSGFQYMNAYDFYLPSVKMDSAGVMAYLSSNGITTTGLTGAMISTMFNTLATTKIGRSISIYTDYEGRDPTGSNVSANPSTCDGVIDGHGTSWCSLYYDGNHNPNWPNYGWNLPSGNNKYILYVKYLG